MRCSLEGVLGGVPLGEGVLEDLPLSDYGMKCMDPVATLQDDVKRNVLNDARGARLKAGGFLPHPFIGCFNMKHAFFAPV